MSDNTIQPNNLSKMLDEAGRTLTWLHKSLGDDGLGYNHLSQVGLQKKNTTIPVWIKIADLLECSLDDLLRKDIS